jgi:hypothetical protein
LVSGSYLRIKNQILRLWVKELGIGSVDWYEFTGPVASFYVSHIECLGPNAKDLVITDETSNLV